MSKSFMDNTIVTKLRNKEMVCASWAQLGSNLSTEIIAEAGFDMVVIDMEHAAVTISELISMIQATKGTECIPVVRAPWNDMVIIKQILDCGAYGVHVPYVSTREEAEYAVKACKYAPQGVRGIAGSQRAVNYSLSKMDYYERANKDILVMVAIETPEGVENIEEILSVEGLDGVFIGPADLSTAMGYLANPSEEEVQKSIKKIEDAVFASDKFLGTVASDMKQAAERYERGYSLLYVMSDTVGLANLAAARVEDFQGLKKDIINKKAVKL